MNMQLPSWIYSNECAAGFVLLEAPVCLYTVYMYSVWVHVHVARPHAHLKLYSLYMVFTVVALSLDWLSQNEIMTFQFMNSHLCVCTIVYL